MFTVNTGTFDLSVYDNFFHYSDSLSEDSKFDVTNSRIVYASTIADLATFIIFPPWHPTLAIINLWIPAAGTK